MKNPLTKFALSVLITVIAMNFSFANDPTYVLSTQNIRNISPNSLEFDIYLQHTNPGESKFNYVLGQYFYDFNADIANGGTLTYSVVNSDLPQGFKPVNASPFKNLLRISVNMIPPMDNLPAISDKAPGTLIATMKLETSAKEFASVPLNLKMRNGPENPFTKVSALIDGKIKDVTIPAEAVSDNNGGTNGKEPSSVIPKSYALFQNFPNPFNPSTSIKFDVPNLAGVKLAIYDITGREISVLVNEQLQPGSYSYTWNGSQFASGIYFYQIRSNGFVQTNKMVMIK